MYIDRGDLLIIIALSMVLGGVIIVGMARLLEVFGW